MAVCMALRMARRKRTRRESCSATPWATNWGPASGSDFENVQLDLPWLRSSPGRADPGGIGAAVPMDDAGRAVWSPPAPGSLVADLLGDGPRAPCARRHPGSPSLRDVIVYSLWRTTCLKSVVSLAGKPVACSLRPTSRVPPAFGALSSEKMTGDMAGPLGSVAAALRARPEPLEAWASSTQEPADHEAPESWAPAGQRIRDGRSPAP